MLQKHGIKAPAIFIVGEVVTLREQLAWFDQRLLFGKTALVTRAREQASALTCQLEDLGAQCIEAPAIKLVPPESYAELDEAIEKLSTYHWLIFTSVNGVEHFFTRLYDRKKDSRALGNARIAAIGAQTAARLRDYGILADIVPLEFRAEGIVAAMAGRIEPGMSVLIPRALVARDILPEKLREMGAKVNVVPVYRTITGETDGEVLAGKLKAGEIDLVTFTSSSTVTNLLELLGSQGAELLKNAKVACIGPITAGTCLEHGITPDVIAEEYTIHGMVEAIVKLYEEAGK